MKYYFSMFIFTIFFSCNTNNKTQFTILTYNTKQINDSIFLNKWLDKNGLNASLNNDNIYFEDEEYIVTGFCLGEFGGDLYFLDKTDTSYVYYLSCTCPLFVEKIDNEFVVTKTLAHMEGSGAILKIKTPKDLVKLKKDSLQYNWKEIRFPKLDYFERYNFLECQNSCFIDTTGLMMNIFFKRNDKDFIIYNDLFATYLGEIQNKKIVMLDTIINIQSYGYNGKCIKINDIYKYTFTNRNTSVSSTIGIEDQNEGSIYVKEDTIVFAY